MNTRIARWTRTLAFCVLPVLFASATHAKAASTDSVTLLGVDELGNPIQTVVSSRRYTEQLARTLETLNDSSLAALRSRPAKSASWRIRTVIVGLGATAEFGVPALIKLGVTPRFRVAFSNSTDPVLP